MVYPDPRVYFKLAYIDGVKGIFIGFDLIDQFRTDLDKALPEELKQHSIKEDPIELVKFKKKKLPKRQQIDKDIKKRME